MGKKYIIELLDDCPSEFKGIIVFGLTPTGQISAEPIPVEDLTTYTEPDLEQVRKEAYEEGLKDGRAVMVANEQNNAFNDGYKKCLKDMEQVRKEAYAEGYKEGMQLSIDDAKLKEEYQQGLNDAWDAARKIIRMPEGDLLNLFDVYSSVCTSVQAILKYDASEAIEKIRQYEQEQEEIKVGDEVGYYGVADEDGNVCYSGVVLEIRKDDYLVMEKDGKTYQLKKKLVMSKTGRHFPEIAAVLEKIRGEQE